MSKRRDYFITTHTAPATSDEGNWCKHLVDEWDEGRIEYYVWGHEIGKKNEKDHWHIYVYYKNARSVLATRRKFKLGKVEAPRDADDCIGYCMKDGDYHEYGKQPYAGCRTDLERCKYDIDRMIKTNTFNFDELEEMHFGVFAKYERFFKNYISKKLQKLIPKKRETLVFIGKAGSGKTQKALDLLSDDYYFWNGHSDSKFWEGYTGQKEVLIDDFRGEMPLGLLLRLTDPWPDRKKPLIEVKGGSFIWLAEKIIITSNRDISDWFSFIDPEDLAALKRRFRVKYSLTGTEVGWES